MEPIPDRTFIAEVWDILNAGPLHRFTANGLLVHNCLDDGTVREQTERTPPLPKKCPKCFFVRPPKASGICPNCGFEAKPVNTVVTVNGELTEKKPEEGKYTKVQKLRQRTGQIILNTLHLPLRDFYSQLLGYCQAHGYRPGWASNKYREAVGVWPNAHRSAPPRAAGPEVASWIRAGQIRFAKGRERGDYRAAAD